MSNKRSFLDNNGLLYLWNKIKNVFVAKEAGKGLSTNDYSNDEKSKLANIEAGATNTTVENVLTSTSETNALSAAQGKALKDQIDGISDTVSTDAVLKSVYDTDNNGKVDSADDADKLGGVAASNYVQKDGNKVLSTNDLTNELKVNYDAAYEHSQADHAPVDAEKNTIESISVNGVAQEIKDENVNITVPTKVSELENDEEYVVTNTFNEELAKKVDKVDGYSLVDDDEIAKLSGVSANAKKVEKSNTNGNIKIDDVETVVYTHPTSHTASEISDFATEVAKVKVANATKADEATKATQDGNGNVIAGTYAEKATTLAGYGITNAYTTTETDTKIAEAVANSEHTKRTIVTAVPSAADAEEHIIYMVKDTSVAEGEDAYDEYMLIDGAVVKVGDTTVDLTDYQKSADLVAIENSEIDTICV